MVEIVKFPVSDLSDIPAMLRTLADRIESGDVDPFATMVVVGVGQPPQSGLSVFHFGGGSPLEIMGALSVAHHCMINF